MLSIYWSSHFSSVLATLTHCPHAMARLQRRTTRDMLPAGSHLDFWHGTRLGPSTSLGRWASESEDPWRDYHWLHSGYGVAVLSAWRMLVMEQKYSCAIYNARTAAEKLRQADRMEAHHWGTIKKRRTTALHNSSTSTAITSSDPT